jgi:hypothetical protein
MTLAAPCPALPGVVTRSALKSRNPNRDDSGLTADILASKTPINKRPRVQAVTPSTAVPAPANVAFEQWLDDVANVDISLSISMGYLPKPQDPPIAPADASISETQVSDEAVETAQFSVSIPTMLTRVLHSKLAIDPSRLSTHVKSTECDSNPSSEVFVALSVKGREEPIADAIAGGLTPRKAFLRSAPHISRVASRLQDCMRQIFGMKDFVVRVE